MVWTSICRRARNSHECRRAHPRLVCKRTAQGLRIFKVWLVLAFARGCLLMVHTNTCLLMVHASACLLMFHARTCLQTVHAGTRFLCPLPSHLLERLSLSLSLGKYVLLLRGVQALMIHVSQIGWVSSSLFCLIIIKWVGLSSCLFHLGLFKDHQAMFCSAGHLSFVLWYLTFG